MPTLPPLMMTANKSGVTVSGSITDFMTGATSRPSWKVTLTYDGDRHVKWVCNLRSP